MLNRHYAVRRDLRARQVSATGVRHQLNRTSSISVDLRQLRSTVTSDSLPWRLTTRAVLCPPSPFVTRSTERSRVLLEIAAVFARYSAKRVPTVLPGRLGSKEF